MTFSKPQVTLMIDIVEERARSSVYPVVLEKQKMIGNNGTRRGKLSGGERSIFRAIPLVSCCGLVGLITGRGKRNESYSDRRLQVQAWRGAAKRKPEVLRNMQFNSWISIGRNGVAMLCPEFMHDRD
jgi:hypothetical protein